MNLPPLSWPEHSPIRRRLSSYAIIVSLGLWSCSAATKGGELPPSEAKPLKGSQVKQTESEVPQEEEEPARVKSTRPPLPWSASAFSPKPGSTPEPLLEKAVTACGRSDAALHDAAFAVAEEYSSLGKVPDLQFATFHMKRFGAPYVLPRLWSIRLPEIDEGRLSTSVKSWAHTRSALGEFRCGAALVEGDEGSYVVVLQVDVTADIQPLPTQVASGDWLDFEAHFLAPTSAATVLLLPPEGPPRRINPEVHGDKTKTRFSIETSGTWLIQLMATQIGGPRPVAQILITADDPPPTGPDTQPVPGEEALDEKATNDDALFALLNSAREEHGLPLVRRNRKLDRLAREHSLAMGRLGRISHNTGQGDPQRRVGKAGLSPKATGENVARAASVLRIHRVLWGSPAHRENLLLRRWDEVGVAVFRSKEGGLFASELFIDSE